MNVNNNNRNKNNNATKAMVGSPKKTKPVQQVYSLESIVDDLKRSVVGAEAGRSKKLSEAIAAVGNIQFNAKQPLSLSQKVYLIVMSSLTYYSRFYL